MWFLQSIAAQCTLVSLADAGTSTEDVGLWRANSAPSASAECMHEQLNHLHAKLGDEKLIENDKHVKLLASDTQEKEGCMHGGEPGEVEVKFGFAEYEKIYEAEEEEIEEYDEHVGSPPACKRALAEMAVEAFCRASPAYSIAKQIYIESGALKRDVQPVEESASGQEASECEEFLAAAEISCKEFHEKLKKGEQAPGDPLMRAPRIIRAENNIENLSEDAHEQMKTVYSPAKVVNDIRLEQWTDYQKPWRPVRSAAPFVPRGPLRWVTKMESSQVAAPLEEEVAERCNDRLINQLFAGSRGSGGEGATDPWNVTAEWKPGDWICLSCGDHVFARKAYCRCGGERRQDYQRGGKRAGCQPWHGLTARRVVY